MLQVQQFTHKFIKVRRLMKMRMCWKHVQLPCANILFPDGRYIEIFVNVFRHNTLYYIYIMYFWNFLIIYRKNCLDYVIWLQSAAWWSVIYNVSCRFVQQDKVSKRIEYQTNLSVFRTQRLMYVNDRVRHYATIIRCSWC